MISPTELRLMLEIPNLRPEVRVELAKKLEGLNWLVFTVDGCEEGRTVPVHFIFGGEPHTMLASHTPGLTLWYPGEKGEEILGGYNE